MSVACMCAKSACILGHLSQLMAKSKIVTMQAGEEGGTENLDKMHSSFWHKKDVDVFSPHHVSIIVRADNTRVYEHIVWLRVSISILSLSECQDTHCEPSCGRLTLQREEKC